MAQGTSYGNITDLNGKYTLIISNPEATLIFSYVGYQTISESIGGRNVIDILMKIDETQLDELIVT